MHDPMTLKEAMMWALIAIEQKALSADTRLEETTLEEAFEILHKKLLEDKAEGTTL